MGLGEGEGAMVAESLPIHTHIHKESWLLRVVWLSRCHAVGITPPIVDLAQS